MTFQVINSGSKYQVVSDSSGSWVSQDFSTMAQAQAEAVRLADEYERIIAAI